MYVSSSIVCSVKQQLLIADAPICFWHVKIVIFQLLYCCGTLNYFIQMFFCACVFAFVWQCFSCFVLIIQDSGGDGQAKQTRLCRQTTEPAMMLSCFLLCRKKKIDSRTHIREHTHRLRERAQVRETQSTKSSKLLASLLALQTSQAFWFRASAALLYCCFSAVPIKHRILCYILYII